MIRYIKGTILESEANSLLLITSSGLGYKVYTDMNTAMSSTDGEAVSLYTYHHIREDIESLFGFKNKKDLELFELLISVSGLGPKSALALLSANNVNTIVNAIANNNLDLLNKAPGLGKKTLEKMVLELKDKVSAFSTTPINNNQNELRLALVSLGYSTRDIDIAISGIDKNILENNNDLNILLKEAFKYL